MYVTRIIGLRNLTLEMNRRAWCPASWTPEAIYRTRNGFYKYNVQRNQDNSICVTKGKTYATKNAQMQYGKGFAKTYFFAELTYHSVPILHIYMYTFFGDWGKHIALWNHTGITFLFLKLHLFIDIEFSRFPKRSMEITLTFRSFFDPEKIVQRYARLWVS